MQLSWLEQLICNQQVVGSSPSIGSDFGEILKRPTRTDCKSVGFTFAGSNPALPTTTNKSGSSSVGRASAFQAECRRFEPGLPLKKITSRCSSVVERFLGKEEVPSSILGIGSSVRAVFKKSIYFVKDKNRINIILSFFLYFS